MQVKPWHIGMLTHDIEKTLSGLRLMPGIEIPGNIDISFTADEMDIGEPMSVKVCNVDCCGMALEIIQPTGDGDSYQKRELKRQGPGLHHLAYALGDEYDSVIGKLKRAGWIIRMAAHKGGVRNCFVESPDAALILELIERIPG